jgi:hypothetical protein
VSLAGSGSRTSLGGAFGCLFGGALGGAAGVVTGVILDYVVLAAVDDEATPAMLTYTLVLTMAPGRRVVHAVPRRRGGARRTGGDASRRGGSPGA